MGQAVGAVTMAERSKLDRVVEARMRLRERFLARVQETPAMGGDPPPQGSGPPNRHGMPRLPPGQYETKGWPVLDLGVHPAVALERWKLTIDGACDEPLALSWNDLVALEQVEDVSDFHCVTTWSRYDLAWRGVRLADVIALAAPRAGAEHVMLHAYDGYSTNLPLVEAIKPDVLLAHTVDGKPLPVEHGGPVRVITPQLYAWKGAKWVNRVEIMTRNRRGFWEERGYSSSAHPWRDDRYG
jgi:DMSO/TMAO reductase YedYZ molybdopterin-dependent catalytic subunit